MVGISKGPDRDAGREHFYLPGKEPFRLDPKNPVLYYLQRLRDEAHRFANTYNAELRSRKIRESILEDIPGLGPSRRAALLAHRLHRATDVGRRELDAVGARHLLHRLAAPPHEADGLELRMDELEGDIDTPGGQACRHHAIHELGDEVDRLDDQKTLAAIARHASDGSTRLRALSRVQAAQHASLLLLGVAIGSLAIGRISDRLGSRRGLMRVYAGHFTPTHHLGFEFCAWYWHFVDVVWRFLFACIYVWGGGTPLAH